jgi:hypothetical protein
MAQNSIIPENIRPGTYWVVKLDRTQTNIVGYVDTDFAMLHSFESSYMFSYVKKWLREVDVSDCTTMIID